MRRSLLILIVFLSISCFTRNRTLRIGIQPFENFDPVLIDTIALAIRKTYEADVYILPSVKLPESAFIHVKSPRYRADSLIKYLKRNKSDTLDYVLGLTHNDISTTKRDKFGRVKQPPYKYTDWGIFGLGYRPGPSCVVSSYRIKTMDQELFFSRLKKICIHELGHNMGLPHCSSEKCVMQDAAETIRTIDRVHQELCEKCRRIIVNVTN